MIDLLARTYDTFFSFHRRHLVANLDSLYQVRRGAGNVSAELSGSIPLGWNRPAQSGRDQMLGFCEWPENAAHIAGAKGVEVGFRSSKKVREILAPTDGTNIPA